MQAVLLCICLFSPLNVAAIAPQGAAGSPALPLPTTAGDTSSSCPATKERQGDEDEEGEHEASILGKRTRHGESRVINEANPEALSAVHRYASMSVPEWFRARRNQHILVPAISWPIGTFKVPALLGDLSDCFVEGVVTSYRQGGVMKDAVRYPIFHDPLAPCEGWHLPDLNWIRTWGNSKEYIPQNNLFATGVVQKLMGWESGGYRLPPLLIMRASNLSWYEIPDEC